jgi:enoyl-CoA hydratase
VSTRLIATERDKILQITLESDDGYPRLECELLDPLVNQIAHLAGDSTLAGAMITGSERAFATGAEITEIAKLTAAKAREFSRHGQMAMSAVANSEKPIVAAIRGYCIGGGLDLALACHSRIASRDAVFAHPGGSLGIITGWGGTQRLPRLIGRSIALEILTTGRRFSAEEALAVGLIREIVSPEEVTSAAMRLLRSCAKTDF